jgi:hypothetical protein
MRAYVELERRIREGSSKWLHTRSKTQVCVKTITRYIDKEVDKLFDITEWTSCDTGKRVELHERFNLGDS